MSSWFERAACRDVDPELFFPIGVGDAVQAQIAQAKTVCLRCPVVKECLAWSIDNAQDAGIWGGLTEQERRDQRHTKV